jgi:hypothetical protein
MRIETVGLILGVLGVLVGETSLTAQFQMPDAKRMSGIPRPVDDLPNSAVSVRLVRGDLANNITNHPVDLVIEGRTVTVRTDDAGRAEFHNLTPGAPVKAQAVVDGESLQSQEFPVPREGGIRLLLVATDREKEARAAEEAKATPIDGQVAIGGDSRIILEPDDELVRVFYLLQIVNTARAPVNPPSAFVFDVPDEAVSTSVLDGSSKLASASGTRVRVQGPFPPGETVVQVGFDLPASQGEIELSQAFPALFEQVAVIAKKVGNSQLNSAQLDRREDVANEGQLYTVAGGNTLAAGTPLVLSITGMPYRSAAPRWIVLTISGVIFAMGVWGSWRPQADAGDRKAERKRLIARREKLFQELVRLETEHRQGRGDRGRFESRREELLRSLEQIYTALDADEATAEPPGRAGAAAPLRQLGAS